MERQQIQSLAEAGRAELARIRQLVSEEQRHRPTEAGVDDSTRSRNAGHKGRQAVHEGKEFGDYATLLQNAEFFKKSGIAKNKEIFVERLREIRTMRNSIMHFHPDEIESSTLNKLREFHSFLADSEEALPH